MRLTAKEFCLCWFAKVDRRFRTSWAAPGNVLQPCEADRHSPLAGDREYRGGHLHCPRGYFPITLLFQSCQGRPATACMTLSVVSHSPAFI